jgi:hypothetical protein
MGYEAKKTEHAGPKRGQGAYWGLWLGCSTVSALYGNSVPFEFVEKLPLADVVLRACPSFPAIRGRQVTPLQGPRT